MPDIKSLYAQLDNAHSEIRQLLQQRFDLRKERDAAFEAGARSMRDRSARVYEAMASETSDTGAAALLDRLTAAVRALPLLADGGDTDLCAGLAGHTGDHFTADDLRGLREALTRRTARPAPCGAKGVGLLNGPLSCDLVDGHEGDHAEGEQRWENTTADASFDAGWAAGHAHASADQERISALEALTADMANSHEIQSRQIDELRTDMRAAQTTIRDLGEALREHVQVSIDGLKGHTVEEWREFGRNLRKQDMREARMTSEGDDG